MVKFFVVQVDYAYNVVLGWTTLTALHALTFKVKFLSPYGVWEVKGDQDICHKCYRHTLTSSSVGVSK